MKNKIEAPYFALASDAMIYGAGTSMSDALWHVHRTSSLQKGINICLKGCTEHAFTAWHAGEKSTAFDCTGPIVCLKSELSPAPNRSTADELMLAARQFFNAFNPPGKGDLTKELRCLRMALENYENTERDPVNDQMFPFAFERLYAKLKGSDNTIGLHCDSDFKEWKEQVLNLTVIPIIKHHSV